MLVHFWAWGCVTKLEELLEAFHVKVAAALLPYIAWRKVGIRRGRYNDRVY
jgi:hypothetical protein